MVELNPYARFLDGRPVSDILAATPAALGSALATMSPEHQTTSPAPGKWSPAEILAHLADCEIAFAFRLRQTLAQDHHILQPFDQDKWAAAYPGLAEAVAGETPSAGAHAKSGLAASALATFTALRRWNLILIHASLPAAAHKHVTHPERGTMTFTTITETMAGHDLNHLLQIRHIAALPA